MEAEKRNPRRKRSNRCQKFTVADWIYTLLLLRNIQGLEWVNMKESIFRISWLHGSNLLKHYETDMILATEWAKLKGRSDLKDHKKLKGRLRCALHCSRGLLYLGKVKNSRYYKILTAREMS